MSKTILTPDMAKSVATFIQEFEEDFKTPVSINVGTMQSSIHIADPDERKSLEDIELLVIRAMHEFSDDLKKTTTLVDMQTRKRDVLMWRQAYEFIVHRYGYSKIGIGRYLKKNHATVINSIKKTEIYRETNEPGFCKVYNFLIKYIKEHVGITSGIINRQTDAKSTLTTICN
tara:strand:- start:173 stop:691 length:519 start_codon:yes stop_codon:yes gene_type:complete